MKLNANINASQDYIILFLIGAFIIGCIWYYYREDFELKCVVAGPNGNTYCVRNRGAGRTEESAKLLDEATQRMQKLVDYVNQKYPDNEAVKRLVAGFNPKKINETLPDSTLVAYTENKSKMSFCLTEKKNGTKLIDINTLMFVAIHELSHISSKSIGHKTEFWENFKFLLREASEIKVYELIDYSKTQKSYCDMEIKDNPVYNYKGDENNIPSTSASVTKSV
jgi:hypothetical protein